MLRTLPVLGDINAWDNEDFVDTAECALFDFWENLRHLKERPELAAQMLKNLWIEELRPL